MGVEVSFQIYRTYPLHQKKYSIKAENLRVEYW